MEQLSEKDVPGFESNRLGGVVRVVSGSVEVEMGSCILESSLEFSKLKVCIRHLTQQFYLQISS